MSHVLPLGLAAALVMAAAAQAAPPAAPRSGVYAVEPSHTEVMFGIDHLGFSTYYGQFPGASGTLTLDANAPAKSALDISIPVASVMTASPKLNEELAGPQWLDAGKFPTMTFHATKIVKTGAATADVTGDFTLHGVTRPVTLKATFHGAGAHPMTKAYTVGFDATGHISRKEYGVSTFEPLLGDDVQLTLSAAFEKKPS